MIIDVLGCIATFDRCVQCLIQQALVDLLVVHPELFKQLTQILIITHPSCLLYLISIILRQNLVRLLNRILGAPAARSSLHGPTNINNSHSRLLLLMRRQLNFILIMVLLMLATMLRLILHRH